MGRGIHHPFIWCHLLVLVTLCATFPMGPIQCLLPHGFTTCHIIGMALHLPHITQPMVLSVARTILLSIIFHIPYEAMLFVMVKACLWLNIFQLFRIIDNFVLIHAYKQNEKLMFRQSSPKNMKAEGLWYSWWHDNNNMSADIKNKVNFYFIKQLEAKFCIYVDFAFCWSNCRSWFSLEQNCWFIEDKLSSTTMDFIRSEGIAERQHLIWGKASSLSMPRTYRGVKSVT